MKPVRHLPRRQQSGFVNQHGATVRALLGSFVDEERGHGRRLRIAVVAQLLGGSCRGRKGNESARPLAVVRFVEGFESVRFPGAGIADQNADSIPGVRQAFDGMTLFVAERCEHG